MVNVHLIRLNRFCFCYFVDHNWNLINWALRRRSTRTIWIFFNWRKRCLKMLPKPEKCIEPNTKRCHYQKIRRKFKKEKVRVLTWKAETGTERVCLKSSRWAMEWIEEQFDSLESVRLSIPLGSKAGFCLKLTALFLRLSVLNIRWGYLQGDFGTSISNPKLSSPPGCLWMSLPRSRSLLENRRNKPPNPLEAGSSNFGTHFLFFLVSWESSMMVWRSKGVP